MHHPPSSGSGSSTLQAVMTPNPVIVDRDATLDQALALLERYGFRHLPVAECNRVVGILSDRDLRLSTAMLSSSDRLRDRSGQKLPGAERVSEIMRMPVHCLPLDASPRQAAQDMLRLEIGAIPIVDGDVLIGIVTETDFLRLFLEQCRSSHGRCDDLTRYHMHQPLTSVAPETTIEEALDALDRRIGHAGVVREGRLVGIVSERDLRVGLARAMIRDARAQSEGRMELCSLQTWQVMTDRVVTVEPETLLSVGAARMLDARISALPVVDEHGPTGILTQRDVIERFATIP
jgi:CBS domain-containing protein